LIPHLDPLFTADHHLRVSHHLPGFGSFDLSRHKNIGQSPHIARTHHFQQEGFELGDSEPSRFVFEKSGQFKGA
jgi:hypothetical protein